MTRSLAAQTGRRGFTMVELMVALVAGGLLMASLVALSGTVQRSFGYSKEINEVQTNLRFAIKQLYDDISRAAYRAPASPDDDDCHTAGLVLPGSLGPAIAWDGGAQSLTLRGNYISSRDYRVDMNGTASLPERINTTTRPTVVCRNGYPYPGLLQDGKECGGYENYFLPFGDGPSTMDRVFCPGQWIRIEMEEDKFHYHEIVSVDPISLEIELGAINLNVQRGAKAWVNPLTLVRYTFQEDASYTPMVASGEPAAGRWVLTKNKEACLDGALAWGADMEVADFLLPPDPDAPGFQLQVVNDTSSDARYCDTRWTPATDNAPEPVVVAGDIDPLTARALVVTLRGRTLSEDPSYTLETLSSPLPALNHGVDLDGEPTNGLAYVRSETVTVYLRNMDLMLSK